MKWLEDLRQQPWWLESLLLGGLLIIVITAGLVGLGINTRLRNITNYALKFDVELEDRGDDFRIAVLDVRHYHRNIAFIGPTPERLEEFEFIYSQLHHQINRLDEVWEVGPEGDSPEKLRELARRYYSTFRPAVDLYNIDPQAFTQRSNLGLEILIELEGAAQRIDHYGEQRAATAMRRIETAENSARIILLIVLAGLILIGVSLTYLIIKNLRENRRMAAELARAVAIREERERISRHLHDTIGQSLAYLQLNLTKFTAPGMFVEASSMRRDLERMRDISNEAYQQVRQTVLTMQENGSLNLAEALSKQAQEIAEQAELELDFFTEGQAHHLPPLVQRKIQFIFREALHNIKRHAHATAVSLCLTWQPKVLIIDLKDNGAGFDTRKDVPYGHFGLLIMAQRAEEIAAELTITSAPGKGTHVYLRYPFA